MENRYSRQSILPEFGGDGQVKLSNAHVFVVGAGGLGAPVLQYLVGAGIGRLTIIDADQVSASNLHRQTLFRENQVGENKAILARETLKQLNGDCEILALDYALDAANTEALIKDADVVVDCADSFATSYILSDHCHAKNIPFITASVLGTNGYVGGFCGGASSLRAVFPELPDRAANCSTAGVMGPVVGVLGSLQAQMVLSCLLGMEPSPLGQMLSVDCAKFRTSGFRFDNAPEPKGNQLGFIAPSQLQADDFVVELRRTDEVANPVCPGAYRQLVDDFDVDGPKPKEGQRAVMVCRSGLRAWQAANRLHTYWDGEISLIAMGDTLPN